MGNELLSEYNEIYRENLPKEIYKYLEAPEFKRLKNIGYFCGMDYANKEMYDMLFYYSRYDHSINVAAVTWSFTHDLTQTIAALLHDISTPVFSHTIDFLNGDALTQESTEEYTEKIIKESSVLNECLKIDNIAVEDVVDAKKYPIVDNDRPKINADRLEGTLSSNYVWNRTINIEEIKKIYKDVIVVKNEEGLNELGFKSKKSCYKFFKEALILNNALSQNEDKLSLYMLSEMTRQLIETNKITMDDLYIKDEKYVIDLFKKSKNIKIRSLWETFVEMKKIKRSEFYIPDNTFYLDNNVIKVKKRYVNPLMKVDNKVLRLLDFSKEASWYMEKSERFNDSTYAYVELKKVKVYTK